ncbi:virion core protein, T7 gp14 family [Phascolarctobacterium sp.]
MCIDPMTLGIGLTALQGVSQIAATNQQAKAQQAYYEAQAKAAEQNASIQAKKGEQIAEQYAYEQQKLNDRRRLVAGQQAAAFGAAGISGDMGTGLDLSSASDEAYKQDTNRLLGNQRNDQWGNYLGVVNYQNQANAARASAYNVKQQAKQQNIGTILGTAAGIFSAYKNYGGSGKTDGSSNGGFVYQSPYQTNYISPYPGIAPLGKAKSPYF